MAGTPGTFRFPEVNAKPPAPPFGYALLYIKTDNVLYLQDSSGVEIPLGSSSSITSLTGDVTAVGPGAAAAVVVFVGGKTAAEVAQSVTDTQNATSANTFNFIVKRNGSGDIFVTHVNGVLVEAHASRHLPAGADPLTTAAPVSDLTANTSNAVGTANSLARSDHGHAIDTGTPVSTGAANSPGTSPNLVRADHVHNVNTNNGLQNIAGTLSPVYGFAVNTVAQGNDARFEDAQVLRVKLVPGFGEFSSVKAAVDSITTNSSSNRFLVSVGPGIFVEDTITMKPFVSIEGAQEFSTLIQVNATSKDTLIHSTDSIIQNITLKGSTDSGKSSVVFHGGAGGPARILNVRFGAADTLVNINSSVGAVLCEISECSADPTANFTNGLIIQDSGVNTVDCIFQQFFTIAKAPFFTNLIDVSGTLTTLRLNEINVTKNGVTTGTGIKLYNGAQLIIGDTFLWGFNKGLQVPNTGAAPNILGNSVSFKLNTTDVEILHPGTTGAMVTIADKSKITNNAPGVSFVDFDPVNAGIILTDGIFQGSDFSKITDVTPVFQHQTTMGVMSGGGLSAIGLNLTAQLGTGYLSIGTHPSDYLQFTSWITQVIAIPTNSERYIYIDNTATLQSAASPPDSLQNIILGEVITDGSSIYLIQHIAENADHLGNASYDFITQALGPIYESGSIVTENATPGRLNVGSGSYWYGTARFTPSGGSAIFFIPYFRNGVGGYTKGASIQDVSSAPMTWQYDNNSGGLVNIPGTNYAKHSLYVVNDGADEKYLFVYAQTTYATLVEVETADIPLPPNFFDTNITLIATIVVHQGDTNIKEIRDERPVVGFKASGISATAVHGNLLGLLADDHPQYLRTDGTRALTGSQSFGGNNATNVGTVNGVVVEAHESRHLPNGADPLTTAAPVANLTATTTNAVGTANSLARSDHGHAIDTGPASTQTPDQGNATGTSANLARADHIHNIPSAIPVQIGTSNFQGSASSFSLSDHVHAHGNQTAGSLHAVATTSVNGFMSAVDKSKLDTISAIAATNAQILISDGTTYNPRTVSADASIDNTGAVTVNSVGSSSAANIHSAELAANAATSANTANTIVKRGANGEFSSGAHTIVGATDTVQLSVKGFSTQTSDIFDVLKSDNTNLFKVTNAGNGTFFGNIAAANFSGSSSGTNTGDVTLSAFGSSPNANAASLSGQVLTLQPADATNPGGVSTTTQTFAGNKTFLGTITGTSESLVGTADTVQLSVKGNGTQTSDIFDVLKSDNTNLFKVTNAGNGTFFGSITASNFSGTSSGTNTGDVTLTAVGASPNANAASLSGQVLTLQPADNTNPGVLTAGAQTIGGSKTFSSAIIGSVTGTAANVTGVVAIANGGTNNSSTYTAGSVIFSNGTSLTQDNSNFYWDDTQHALGIGVIPATNAILDVAASTTSATQVEQLTGYGINNIGIRVRHARGTSGSPSALQLNDILAFLGARGYGTSQFAAANTGSIHFTAAEIFTNTANGTHIVFNTTPTGSVTLAETMRLSAAGNLLIGTTTDSGTQKLQVNGNSAVGTVTSGVWNGTNVAVANGGTGASTAPAARVNLNIDERTTFSNANYTVLNTDRYVAQVGTMSAPRTVTLPAANTLNAGQQLVIADESGTVSTTNTLTITAGGTDTIDGAASKSVRSAYGYILLYSNGSNMWFSGVLRIGGGGTGVNTLPTDGQLLIGSTANSNYAVAALTAGTGVSVTNGSGSITLASTSTFAQTTKTANYTILSTDATIFCDTSGGAFTLTLPDPSTLAGKIYRIIDTTGNFGTNNLTLARHASEKIEGLAASKVLQTNWGWFNVTTNSTDWYCG